MTEQVLNATDPPAESQIRELLELLETKVSLKCPPGIVDPTCADPIVSNDELIEPDDPADVATSVDTTLIAPTHLGYADTAEPLLAVLALWVAYHARNGIVQHGPGWHEARKYTIGGSSLSVLMGLNPWGSVDGLISEKIGFSEFKPSTAVYWGNLFEDIVKQYLEWMYQCVIVGDWLFVIGKRKCTSYSPDGLAVVRMVFRGKLQWVIVLFEIKTPFGRIPAGKPPKYYVPQVKMGLDLLELPVVGILAEAVIRRCEWTDLNHGPAYNPTPSAKKRGTNPLAYGFIGFALASGPAVTDPAYTDWIINRDTFTYAYTNALEAFGDAANDYLCADIGDVDVAVFDLVMLAYSQKLLVVRPSKMIICARDDQSTATIALDHELDLFIDECKESAAPIVGMLPWKLFCVQDHTIDHEAGYVDQWIPKIEEIVGVVRACTESPEKSLQIYQEYLGGSGGAENDYGDIC